MGMPKEGDMAAKKTAAKKTTSKKAASTEPEVFGPQGQRLTRGGGGQWVDEDGNGVAAPVDANGRLVDHRGYPVV